MNFNMLHNWFYDIERQQASVCDMVSCNVRKRTCIAAAVLNSST